MQNTCRAHAFAESHCFAEQAHRAHSVQHTLHDTRMLPLVSRPACSHFGWSTPVFRPVGAGMAAAPVVDGNASVQQLFGDFDSVETRFPNIKGKVLMDVIWRCYVIPSSGSHLKYFDANGQRLLFRHHLNRRWQDTLNSADM